MKEELRPCPFCGGKVTANAWVRLGGTEFICEECGARTIFVEENGNIAKNIEAWNKRETDLKKGDIK